MHWMNPTGAWALTALAAILVLYILKQRMEPVTVSSTYLWNKALASLEADRPFQKLRRNLLLFLQLLLALLLALSIMRPMTLGGETGEMIFVFDLSASMQADAGDGSRLDAAVEDAKRRIDGLPDGARVSVLTAGAQVAQPVARASDLVSARRQLDTLTPENGQADLEGALSLATALQRELEDAQLVVYTDAVLPEGNNGIIQPRVGVGAANCAILSLQATETAAVARVVAYGGDADITVECYADGTLVDMRTVSLAANEVSSVHFELPSAAEQVRAYIVEADALMIDNERYWARREAGATTVTMAGRSNIFVEKAISLREDITLQKTTLEEVGAVATGALTVLDGPLPEILPENGALLLIDPDGEYVGARNENAVTLSPAFGTLADSLNAHLQVDEIQLMQYRPVIGGTPIWLANGEPVLSILEEDGRRIAVIGFNLHESNLPLLKEFPIFMQQLMAYLAPEPLGVGFSDGDAGMTLPVMPQSFAREAWVELPSGRSVSMPITGGLLTDTNDLGIYRLIQVDEAGERTQVPFTLHVPAPESDVSQVAAGSEQTAKGGRGTVYGREWTPWLIGLLLAVMLLEWWVYRRGY